MGHLQGRAAEAMYRQIWKEWSTRSGPLPFPLTSVIPNGVDLAPKAATTSCGGHAGASWSRPRKSSPDLQPVVERTKGDYRACSSRSALIDQWPHAVLVLSGRGTIEAFCCGSAPTPAGRAGE